MEKIFYWENGFYEEQNQNNTRKPITYEKYLELLSEQSKGAEIISGDDGFPIIKYLQVSEQEKVNMQIEDLKLKLKETDYQAIKFAEGELTAEEYEPIRLQRKVWREEINRLGG